MHILFTIAYFAAIIALGLLFSDFNPFSRTYPTMSEEVDTFAPTKPIQHEKDSL